MCCNSHRADDPAFAKRLDEAVKAREAREARNARRRMLYALKKANGTVVEEPSYTIIFATNGTITGTTVEATKERDLVTA